MVVVIVAHPDLSRSVMNKSLLQALSGAPDIEVIDLYQRYRQATFAGLPEALLAEDRVKLAEASAIVLQFPFYWYSMPSLLKQWLDDILLNGWAHHGGVEGKHYALAGKSLLIALTTGGAERSYNPGGYNMHWLSDFMPSFVQTARTCKMHFVVPYCVHADKFDPLETPRAYLQRVHSLPATSELFQEKSPGRLDKTLVGQR